MKKLTLQAAFDINWRRFVVEKRPKSMKDGSVSCIYFKDKDCRCGIGWCLPKKVCIRINDEGTVHSVQGDIEPYFENDVSIDDLRGLQNCHDEADHDNFHSSVKENLLAFAAKHGMKVPKAA